jgi:4-hydroxybenzoate polyprenyltransferase
VKSTRPDARTFLVLGRVSNLPTVWTNCLVGWVLGDGGPWWRLLLLLVGSSALYVGGMYLNDAFDAAFDRQHRRERPIPAGRISEALVWRIGFGLLGAGAILMAVLGWTVAAFTALLVVAILVYDAVHKAVAFSPVLMAACRLFLFLAAAAAGRVGVTGLALWTALALAGWIVGLSYVARRESVRGALAWWPLVALASPLVLSALVNDGPWRLRGMICSAVVIAWAGWCLGHVLGAKHRNLGRGVSGLLAGICLVDLLALAPPPLDAVPFLVCFGAALLAQRFVPAT